MKPISSSDLVPYLFLRISCAHSACVIYRSPVESSFAVLQCLCSDCAKELRIQSNKCPVCRQPIEELLEIKIDEGNDSTHIQCQCSASSYMTTCGFFLMDLFAPLEGGAQQLAMGQPSSTTSFSMNSNYTQIYL